MLRTIGVLCAEAILEGPSIMFRKAPNEGEDLSLSVTDTANSKAVNSHPGLRWVKYCAGRRGRTTYCNSC